MRQDRIQCLTVDDLQIGAFLAQQVLDLLVVDLQKRKLRTQGRKVKAARSPDSGSAIPTERARLGEKSQLQEKTPLPLHNAMEEPTKNRPGRDLRRGFL